MTFHLNNPKNEKVFKFRILAASLNINFNQHVNHSEGKLLIKIMQNICEIYVSDKFKIISICNNKRRTSISFIQNREAIPSSTMGIYDGCCWNVMGRLHLE